MANASPSRKGLVRDSQAGLLGLVYTGAWPGAAALAANTALTGVLVGTPVSPALAVDSIIISNLVADGDILLATQTGGNSQAWIRADASAGTLDIFGAGTLVAVISATVVEIEDGIILALGNDQDQAFVNRTTILAANTALTGVVVGTPVTPAIAANSLIISNVTADGDILLAAQTGGNSQAWLFVDASAGTLNLFGAGTATVIISATVVEIEDGIIFALGNDQDDAFVHRTTTLAANTALTGVYVGTPVTVAVPANSLLISNITADGDIVLAAQTGGNTTDMVHLDASAGAVIINQRLYMGDASARATTQGTETIEFKEGTAPAGAATTTSGIFANATAMQKINAAGTVSAIET